jgi:APA family basic amino acid/polyamine antiporter
MLGTWSAAAVVVGTIIGSGIFRVPADVTAHTGSIGAIALLWVLGGIIALCGALSLAELSAAFPAAGGIYVFLRQVYGPLAAFLFGWGMLIVNPAAYAAVALVMAASVRTLVPMSDAAMRVVAAASLCGLMLANYRSLRFGAALQNVSTAAKALTLVALAMLVFAISDGSGALAGPVRFAPTSWSGFGIALIAVMYAYDGWQWSPQLAAEMKDPARSIPRALGAGVAVVIVVYVLTNAANFHALSLEQVASSGLVTADVATRTLGNVGTSVVASLIVLATLSSNNGGFMTDPRVFYAMAADGAFFRSVAAVHPRFRTPHVAVLVIGICAIAYLPFRDFEQLTATLILGMWPFLALAVAGVIVLRRRMPELSRPFRAPLYPILPIFFLLATAGIFANAIVTDPKSSLINFAVLAAGVPVYFAWRRFIAPPGDASTSARCNADRPA